MTTFLLMRHGIAVDVGERGVTCDADRMLSAEGIRKAEDVVRGLADTGVGVDAVLSSPLLRASETASIAVRLLAPGTDMAFMDELAPGANVRHLLRMLADDGRDLMVVGHMPDMAELAAGMLTASPRLYLQFKKAAVASITFPGPVEAGAGRLDWLLQPRQSRRLKK